VHRADIFAIAQLSCFYLRDALLAQQAVVVCLCLLHAGIETDASRDKSDLFFLQYCIHVSRSTCATLSFTEISVSPKIRVDLPASGTLSQTPDLENFTTATARTDRRRVRLRESGWSDVDST